MNFIHEFHTVCFSIGTRNCSTYVVKAEVSERDIILRMSKKSTKKNCHNRQESNINVISTKALVTKHKNIQVQNKLHLTKET
jgi:hypothetical protein